MRRNIYILTIIISLLSLLFCSQYSLRQYLEIKGNYSPHFISNTEDILFMNSNTGVPQIYRMSMYGGIPEQITEFEEGIDYFIPHPTEDLLIIGADVGGNERTQLYLGDTRGDDLRRITTDDDTIYGFGGFSRNGKKLIYESNERDPRYFDIYLYDIQEGLSEMVLKSDDSNWSVGFSPDDRYIAFLRAIDSKNNDIYLIDLEDNNRIIKITAHDDDAWYGPPVWLNDSSGFYFSSDEGGDFRRLAFYHIDSERWWWARTYNWDLEGYGVSYDGEYLFEELNVNGYDELHIWNMERLLEITPPQMKPGQFNGIQFSNDGKWMVFGFNAPDKPNDLYLWEVGSNKQPLRITYAELAGISESSFISPELIHYRSFDGLEIPAYVYKPEGLSSGEQVPVIVSIHGGPESQSQAWFDALGQYFLSRRFGYIVPNIRGSTGYGKSYEELDDIYRRPDAVRDVEFLADWLISKDWVSKEGLIIEGGSYGGYMVLACLTEQPEIWMAGVDSVGISNFITFLENTGPWRKHLRESEYGYLERDREFLIEISPINKVDEIIAPLVVIQGANDPRVPQGEAEQIVSRARENGVAVLYLLYEDEGHGLSKLENRLDAYPRVVAFLELVMRKDVEIFTETFENKLKSKEKEIFILKEIKSIKEYIKEKKYECASLKLERILEIIPDYPDAKKLHDKLMTEKLISEGIIYYNADELKKSLEIFKRVKEIEPANEIVLNYIEVIESSISLIEREKTRLEKIRDLISEAESYVASRNYEMAIRIYKEVLELEPEYPEIDKRIVSLQSQIGDTTESTMGGNTDKLTDEIKSDYSKGVQLVNSGDYTNGIDLLEKVYSSYGDYKETVDKLTTSYFYLGMKAYGDGQIENAIVCWKRIMDIDPMNKEVSDMLDRAISELEGKFR